MKTSNEVKALVRKFIDEAVEAHSNGNIENDELLNILRSASTMIPESIMQYNTSTYTDVLYEDWDIDQFDLWYDYTFTSEDVFKEG